MMRACDTAVESECVMHGAESERCGDKHLQGECVLIAKQLREGVNCGEKSYHCARFNRKGWSFDSGTTTHVVTDPRYFLPGSARTVLTCVIGVHGARTFRTLRGNVVLHTYNAYDIAAGVGGAACTVNVVVLRDVLLMPTATSNLICEGRLEKDGYGIVSKGGVRVFQDENGGVVCSGRWLGKKENELFTVAVCGTGVSGVGHDTALLAESYHEGVARVDLLHRRHGHCGLRYLRKLYDLPPGAKLGFCSACHIMKNHRRPKRGTHDPQKSFLDRVDSDLTGPFPKKSFKYGNRYCAVLLDVYSRFAWVYFLPDKSATSFVSVFMGWVKLVKTSFGRVCKVFHTDGGGEFVNDKMKTVCAEEGIELKFSAPYLSGSHNPYVERKHRSVKECAHSMRSMAGLPMMFWQEAISYAVYVQNRTPHSALGFKTPYEFKTGKIPKLSYIKTFGCEVYAFDPNAPKNGEKGERGIFLGVDAATSAYRVYSLRRQSVILRADCTFNETCFPWRGVAQVTPDALDDASSKLFSYVPLATLAGIQVSGTPTAGVQIETGGQTKPTPSETDHLDSVGAGSGKGGVTAEGATGDESSVSAPVSPRRRSSRNVWRDEFKESLTLPDEDASPTDSSSVRESAKLVTEEGYTVLIDHRGEPVEPSDLGKAMKDLYWPEWKLAMDEEMAALRLMGTWIEVEKDEVLGRGRKPLPCMWVFKIKKERGVITRFKARLTVKGCHQQKGVDYEETFAATAKMKSFRILVALSAIFGLLITQLDISNAFLNGDLEEEVYMHHAPLYKPNRDTVLRLVKTLYGLKQSPRRWGQKISKALVDLGFVALVTDTCVFVHNTACFFIVMHVDDIVMCTDDAVLRASVVAGLAAMFKLTDFGLSKLYIGIEVDDTDGAVRLSQPSYAKDVVKRFNMTDAATKPMPATPNLVLPKLSAVDESTAAAASLHASVSVFPYRSAIGALLYLAVATRPDIACIVNLLAQFCTCFTTTHVTAVKHVLRYIKGTLSKGLYFKRVVGGNKTKGVQISAVCDSDWGTDLNSRKSRTGYVIYIGGAPISWRSTTQRSVALSSCEAEFYALADVVKELLWLKQFLAELGIPIDGPIVVGIDNQAAIALAQNPVSHQRTKHIDIRYFFLREHIEAGTIKLQYVNTKDNVADLLTKNVSAAVFDTLVDRLVV
jgi:transposase InsO family protein